MIGLREDSSNCGSASAARAAFSYVPYGDYVQVAAAGAAMQGGIIIPQNARMGFVVVEVIAAGAGCKLVKAGDRVLIHPEGMVKAKHDGCEVAFTKEDKILAVVHSACSPPPTLSMAETAQCLQPVAAVVNEAAMQEDPTAGIDVTKIGG